MRKRYFAVLKLFHGIQRLLKTNIHTLIWISFLLLPCILLGQPGPSGAADDLAYDFAKHRGKVLFRNVEWGASKEQVLRADNSERRETGRDHLKLSSFLGDVSTDITYFFWKNHLIKGTYISSANYGEYSKFMEKYVYFKDMLTTKHGKPYIDTANWQNMEYKSQPDRWLLAILNGHLEHFSIWEREGIVISIKLTNVNKSVRIIIEYYIANIDEEIERTDDSAVLQDL